jgi:RNA polymerase sigma-70 factor (ECF subfamily)
VPRQEIEADVLRLHAARDFSAAATSAIRGYGPELVGYLRAVVGEQEAALEVFAQLCENVWRSIQLFRAEGSFRAWLYKLAWCAAQDYHRDPYRGRGRRLRTSEASSAFAAVRSSLQPDRELERKERAWRLIEQLDGPDRSLVVLRMVRGLSWREVAEVLSADEAPVDEAAARKRYSRIKQRLRELADAPPPAER